MKRVVSAVEDATATATRDAGAKELLDQIRCGKWRLRIERIRRVFGEVLAKSGDRKAAKEAIAADKKRLMGILWSGRFSRRENDALIEHSGLLCADLDSLNSELPICFWNAREPVRTAAKHAR
jgi:hypothetical protein